MTTTDHVHRTGPSPGPVRDHLSERTVSFPQSLIELVTSKAVAGTAAASLAVAGVAGIQTAADHADERASELLTVEATADDEDGDEGDDLATPEGIEATAEEAPDVVLDDELVEGTDGDEDGDDQGRAAEVHAALTGDETITPGSSEFGQAVAANAQEGKGGEFGRSVAAAASRGASERDDEGDEGEVETADAEADEDRERPEQADSGRPEGTPPSPEGDDSEDGLSRADDARGGERPGRG
jgi:hypothetical protein